MPLIPKFHFFIKFIYSEKAAKFCEIFPLLLTIVHTVKSKGKILQSFVAFSEYMNFNDLSLTRLSQGHRKQKYANGCHFCTLLEKAMQISFVSFFSCLANRTSRYQKIDASWLVNQLHAPYIQCAVGELYTVMHIIKILICKFRHFTQG